MGFDGTALTSRRFLLFRDTPVFGRLFNALALSAPVCGFVATKTDYE
jgi:hypothetical protein